MFEFPPGNDTIAGLSRANGDLATHASDKRQKSISSVSPHTITSLILKRRQLRRDAAAGLMEELECLRVAFSFGGVFEAVHACRCADYFAILEQSSNAGTR